MSATAVDPRGLKRICMSCGVRFYDLNKRPIICPSCDTEFDGEIKVKSRRGRAAVVEKEVPEDTDSKLAKKKPVNENEDEDEIEDEDDGVEVVSLDDAEDDYDDDDDNSVLGDDDDLDDIPDLDDDDIPDDDDDTLLDPDDD